MIMLLLLLMLRLILCWNFHRPCLFSLFLHPGHHAYRDVSDVVDNVDINYRLTFFLGCISSLSHTLHTTLVMMLLGVRLSLDTEHTRSGCPWDENLVSYLVVHSCPPALFLWDVFLLAEHNSGLLQGVKSLNYQGAQNALKSFRQARSCKFAMQKKYKKMPKQKKKKSKD